MPYITKERREQTQEGVYFDEISLDILGIEAGALCENGGDMQYLIAEMIQGYMRKKGLRYQNCQDVMGALAGAQMEFYRCVVGPYEQEKIEENGHVYSRVEMQEGGY